MQEVFEEEKAVYIVTREHGRRCPLCNSPECRVEPENPKWSDEGHVFEINDLAFEFVVHRCKRHRKYFLIEKAHRSRPEYLLQRCSYCNSERIARTHLIKMKLPEWLKEGGDRGNEHELLPSVIMFDKEDCYNCKYAGVIGYFNRESGPPVVFYDSYWSRSSIHQILERINDFSGPYNLEGSIYSKKEYERLMEVLNG